MYDFTFIIITFLCKMLVFITVIPTRPDLNPLCIYTWRLCGVWPRADVQQMQLELSWLDLNTPRFSSRSFWSTWKTISVYMKQLNNEEIQVKNTVQPVSPDFKEGDWLQGLGWIRLDWIASPST